MKVKNIIILLIIGTISSLYINEKYQQYGEKKKSDILQQKLARCQLDNDYYKQFSHKYLMIKKDELNELKAKHRLTKEEKDWLEVYWEAKQEDEENIFVQKQLARVKNKLSGKLNEKELTEILSLEKEIVELERHLEKIDWLSQFLLDKPKSSELLVAR